MSESWLEIPDPEVDEDAVAAEVQHRREERGQAGVGSRSGLGGADEEVPDPVEVAESLYRERFGRSREDPVVDDLAALMQDCGVVPENYAIDWRGPVVGRVHALVRQVINAEIRRYLLPMLEKQGYLNRRMLEALARLEEENAELRRALRRLSGGPG